MKVKMDKQMLKDLGKIAKQAGTQNQWISLALDWIDKADERIIHLSKEYKRLSGLIDEKMEMLQHQQELNIDQGDEIRRLTIHLEDAGYTFVEGIPVAPGHGIQRSMSLRNIKKYSIGTVQSTPERFLSGRAIAKFEVTMDENQELGDWVRWSDIKTKGGK